MNKYLDYTKIGGNYDIPAPKQPNKSKKNRKEHVFVMNKLVCNARKYTKIARESNIPSSCCPARGNCPAIYKPGSSPRLPVWTPKTTYSGYRDPRFPRTC